MKLMKGQPLLFMLLHPMMTMEINGKMIPRNYLEASRTTLSANQNIKLKSGGPKRNKLKSFSPERQEAFIA